MAPPKIVTGARAKVEILDSNNHRTVVGIFTSISYGVVFDATPAYTLGAYGPREIDYTAQEPVSISASGWRVVDQGPSKQTLMPSVNDLMRHEYISLIVTDRQTNKVIATITGVRPTSYQTPIASRQLTEQSFSFMGLLMNDEDETSISTAFEDGTASQMP